jgi:tetrathionate reductase subunit B
MANPHWKMAVDVTRCIGCHACSVACKVEHDVPLGSFRTKVYYYDEGTYPKVRRHFLPTLCMQCEDAPCITACGTKAITRHSDGVVRIDESKCDANGACVGACPYGAIWISTETGADKCDFCSNRLSAGLQPSCVETCPGEVLIFGDANDPDSPYSRFIKEHASALTPLTPDKGTKPAVLYRGRHPKIENKIAAGRNHDPRSYEIDTWASLEPKDKG